MSPSLSEVEALVSQLAQKIDAPEEYLPTYGDSKDGGHPYIEIESGVLFYLAKERGQQTLYYIALDLDDLLYHIFKDVTFMIATKYELKNRVRGQSFRRILFIEQERLIGVLDEKWQARLQKKHEQILVDHPFNDNADERATYYKQLVKNHQYPGNEWSLACEKYPLPDKN
ncbi:Immunity protein 63 [Mucilaginibacter pineti]|uniref:Immunity protein 63 n=1 Tax=Mucilaginibacter pineti TaxID=1391627 RepID=A0A1G6YXR0_9SPHI|nr:Imm63 family immunity protein [Mucilaginibacter pineti]SDD95042.1 Immunity protein 63 [Mucilaginibacter pineti]